MKCSKCGETRESEFYPCRLRRCSCHCKSCEYEYSKKARQKNPEPYRAFVRKYGRNHPEVTRKSFKKWYSENADVHYGRTLAYTQAYPQRHIAYVLAYNAFPDAQICEMEGCLELGERHHDDYDQPLKIRWLCRKHHKELHRKYI